MKEGALVVTADAMLQEVLTCLRHLEGQKKHKFIGILHPTNIYGHIRTGTDLFQYALMMPSHWEIKPLTP